jgi:hypothetical protein
MPAGGCDLRAERNARCLSAPATADLRLRPKNPRWYGHEMSRSRINPAVAIVASTMLAIGTALTLGSGMAAAPTELPRRCRPMPSRR